jgi:hypothetical protein
MIQFYPGVLVKNKSSLGSPQGVSGLYVSMLYVELLVQHVADMGQTWLAMQKSFFMQKV